jgi:DNA-directed RNA polymerase subunit E'/Rpb7
MNERIKELAKKAGINLTPAQFSGVLEDEVDEFMLEDFAESLIQECGVALAPMLRDMVSRGQAYGLIKKHFGVEE